MEQEINKLKLEYQATTPPLELQNSGLDNMWSRVDSHKQTINYFKFAQIFAVLLVVVFITGIVGIKSTLANEGSILYPVKVLANKSIDLASEIPIVNKFSSNKSKSKIHKKSNKIVAPTNFNSPTPSSTPSPTEIKNSKSNVRNENQNKQASEVKGVNNLENKKENIKPIESRSNNPHNNSQEKSNNGNKDNQKNQAGENKNSENSKGKSN